MRANKHLLLWSSLGTLLALMWAAYAEHRQEWRSIQERYRTALPRSHAEAFTVRLRQVYAPALRATDRCVSCHVGMAPGESGVPGNQLFAAHPDVVHDPSRFGCTACHGGQGLATVKADAHGDVRHWPAPMIPRRFAYAGCGSCHTHLRVTNLAALETGRALVERYDCLACHKLDGRGGTVRPGTPQSAPAPDLSRAGATGYRRDWYARHVEQRTYGFAPIPEAEVRTIDQYLDSRAGAPGVVEAKALFHSLGCRGCHPVGGVGRDDRRAHSGLDRHDRALLAI